MLRTEQRGMGARERGRRPVTPHRIAFYQRERQQNRVLSTSSGDPQERLAAAASQSQRVLSCGAATVSASNRTFRNA
jgi:hypothetical protein